MKTFIILFAFTVVQKTVSISINQNILIDKYGYVFDSVLIDLSDENIDNIDIDTFKGYNKLEKLYLEGNKLKQINNGLFNNLTSLRELWLESNNIVAISKDIFVDLNNLEKVCFSNNPISILFPSKIKDLCYTNPNCTIKINEKCIKSNNLSIILIHIFKSK